MKIMKWSGPVESSGMSDRLAEIEAAVDRNDPIDTLELIAMVKEARDRIAALEGELELARQGQRDARAGMDHAILKGRGEAANFCARIAALLKERDEALAKLKAHAEELDRATNQNIRLSDQRDELAEQLATAEVERDSAKEYEREAISRALTIADEGYKGLEQKFWIALSDAIQIARQRCAEKLVKARDRIAALERENAELRDSADLTEEP